MNTYRSTETVEAEQFLPDQGQAAGAELATDDECYSRGWPSGSWVIQFGGGRRQRIEPGQWVIGRLTIRGAEGFTLNDAWFRQKYSREAS